MGRCVSWFPFFYFFFLVPTMALAGDYPVGLYRKGVPHPPYISCTNGTALSSSLKHNLNSTLQTLIQQSYEGLKYGNTSQGSGTDTIYSMFQCRGDLSTVLCWECVATATARLSDQECPSSIGARIQLDRCYLRYDNHSFFYLDLTFVIGYCYIGNSSDRTVLEAIASLVGNVTTSAPQQGGFALAKANSVTAIAQCLGYLSKSECSRCLSHVPYRTLCDSVLGEQLHLSSCYYRFDFSDPAPASVSPSGQREGSPSTTQASLTPSPKRKGLKAILGVAFGVTFVVAALCVGLLWRYNRAKGRQEEADEGWSVAQRRAKLFSLQELEAATRHFHPHNKLGEGGFGPVYKGTLSNGQDIAIKRLSTRSHQGKKEFLNEVNLITSVQHKNLIKLIGSCVTRGERILVYEYLPNKSVDVVLFVKEGRILDWPVRYGIVLGLARGLAYLHEESQLRIIHRDIKPSNILLDDQLNPIISDFGLARLVREKESFINTKIAGTLGYLAPEYAIHGELTEKVDVYGFGVVTLEVISGKRNSNARLLEWAWRLFLQRQHLELVDPKLSDVFSTEQALRTIHVALLCTQEIPKLRPTMSRVVSWLSEVIDISELPTKPPFIEQGELKAVASSSSSSGVCHASNAPQSLISELDPR